MQTHCFGAMHSAISVQGLVLIGWFDLLMELVWPSFTQLDIKLILLAFSCRGEKWVEVRLKFLLNIVWKPGVF